jgi:hypothetical protein
MQTNNLNSDENYILHEVLTAVIMGYNIMWSGESQLTFPEEHIISIFRVEQIENDTSVKTGGKVSSDYMTLYRRRLYSEHIITRIAWSSCHNNEVILN